MFEYFYKEKLPSDETWPEVHSWDVFISSYNSSERVNSVFNKASAKQKCWIIAPEYEYLEEEYPDNGDVYVSGKRQESEFINDIFTSLDLDLTKTSLCIDITGFMRPHLLYLIRYLAFHKVTKFDVLYSEPGQYKKKDETTFSDGPVVQVRPIAGYEGQHVENGKNDLLLLGVGYDHELVKQIVEYKDYAHIATLWGFPSLRADMFQENILRASKAGDAVFSGDWQHNRYYAKANDPFLTADKLREIIQIHEQKEKISNLFLSPLSTKPQVLGFALFYVFDWIDKGSSIIFPFCDSYSRETSTGISAIWKYTVELPT